MNTLSKDHLNTPIHICQSHYFQKGEYLVIYLTKKVQELYNEENEIFEERNGDLRKDFLKRIHLLRKQGRT